MFITNNNGFSLLFSGFSLKMIYRLLVDVVESLKPLLTELCGGEVVVEDETGGPEEEVEVLILLGLHDFLT